MEKTDSGRYNLRTHKPFKFQASSSQTKKSSSTISKFQKARRKQRLIKSKDSLLKIESSKEFKPVPRKLDERIDELCDEYSVKWTEWIQKSTDWSTILILGRGVANEELKRKLSHEVKQNFPEFKFKFVESGPSHVNHLYDPMIQVEGGVNSICQLLLSSTIGETKSFYVVTTAHTILTEEMQQHMDHNPEQQEHVDNDPEQQEHVDNDPEQRRQAVQNYVDGTTFTLKIKLGEVHSESLELNGGAMFAYREYYTPNLTDATESYRSYRNDIAIFRLEDISVAQLERFRTSRNMPNNFPFQGVVEEIPDLSETPFYIHGYKCRFTGGLHGRDNDHITFYPVNEMEERIQLNEGDSGSILYIKEEDVKKAIGMLVSRYRFNVDPWNYRAILLRPSLRELEHIYSDYLTELTVVNVNERLR